MSDIDHDRQPEITCPHCGHVHQDSWDYSWEISPVDTAEGLICDKCEKEFDAFREVDVSYTTRKPKQ